jgi:hypothetical protein
VLEVVFTSVLVITAVAVGMFAVFAVYKLLKDQV